MEIGTRLLRLRDRLGLERAFGPFAPRPRPDAPRVEIRYRRPPDRTRRYEQELLLDREDLKLTLLIVPPNAAPLTVAGHALPPGSSLLWYTFPGRWHEVAALHDPFGRLLGHYGNVIRPPGTAGSIWTIDDLFLDVWLPPGGAPSILDEEEFHEAVNRDWITREEAARARRECRAIARAARAGAWPPPEVRRWPLESVPYLRLRRDAPGTYRAALVSGRVIGYGLYVLGTLSLGALVLAGVEAAAATRLGRVPWAATLGTAAALLLPPALSGRLPATRWPRPAPTDERTIFIGALAAGFAVLLLQEAGEWRAALVGVYAVLGLFSGIFAACRAWYDRRFPVYAAGGLLVCLVALAILLR